MPLFGARGIVTRGKRVKNEPLRKDRWRNQSVCFGYDTSGLLSSNEANPAVIPTPTRSRDMV